jgi:hypothetical protein
MPPQSAQSPPDQGQDVFVTAMFTYAAEEVSDLQLRKGDVIRVISKDDGGWWQGKCRGVRGLFPAIHASETKRVQTMSLRKLV